MTRALLAGTAALIALMGQAVAADISRPAPMPAKAPPPYVAPYYNWTGFYLGINGGGGWGTSTWTGASNGFDTSGGLVGGTAGYNWQTGPWVLGIETDLDWTNIRGSAPCVAGSCQTEANWFGTTRGRIGYAWDRVLPYFTGGVAYGDFKATPAAGFGSADTTNVGWAVGGGVEFALTGNLTGKVEYLHLDLSDFTCTVCAPAATKVDFGADIVRGGLNFKF